MAQELQTPRKMFNYMNDPANPPDVVANQGSQNRGLIPNEPSYVPYDTVDDMGTEMVNRLIKNAADSRELAKRVNSFVAGIGDSVLANLYNKYVTRPSFDSDPEFRVSDYLSQVDKAGQYILSNDEKEFVRRAESKQEADYLLNEVTEFRAREATIGDHPVFGAAGAIFGDSPSLIIPSLGTARTGVAVANAIRITMGAYDVTGAYLTRNELGQSVFNTYLVGGAALLDAGLMVRALRTAKNVKLQKAAEIGGTPPSSASEIRIDPDQPIVKKDISGMADIESDLSNAELIRQYKDNPVGTPVGTSSFERRGFNEDDLNVPITEQYQKLNKEALNKARALKDVDQLVKTKPVRAGAALSKASTLIKGNPEAPFLMEVIESIGEAMPEQATLRMALNSDTRAYTKFLGDSIDIVIPLPKQAKSAKTVAEAMESMTIKELKTLVHESIHAATVNVITKVRKGEGSLQQTQAVQRLDGLLNKARQSFKDLSIEQKKLFKDLKNIKYHLNNTEEFVAGLVNAQNFQKFLMQIPTTKGKESILRSAVKIVMQALGIMPRSTVFSDAVDSLHDLLTNSDTMLRATSVPNFASSTMRPLADEAKRLFGEAPDIKSSKVQAAANGLMEGAKKVFKNNFYLYGQIEQGSPELARKLVANPISNDKAEAAVADYVRRNRTVGDVATAEVETAIYKAAKQQYGINILDQFFNRRKYIQAVKQLENDTFHYLQSAYKNDIRGLEVPTPPQAIKDIVKAYTDSNWAENWLTELKESKVLTSDGQSINIAKSKYYHPVSYSGEKIKTGIRNGMFTAQQVQLLMSKSIRESMPTLSEEFEKKLVEKWYRNITEGAPRVQGFWRVRAQEGAATEVADILAARGLPDDFIDTIIADRELMDQIKPTVKDKNLRARADFDYAKEWDVGEGKVLKLADIQDTAVTKNMMRYNARMAGRAAFARAGYDNLSQLEKVVKAAENALPEGVNERKWRKYVDDTIDTLLGYQVGSNEIPELLRAAGYLSNAMVLKNSGIYGATDLYIGLTEFGFAKVVKAMAKGGLWQDFTKTLGKDNELANRMYTIANQGMKEDIRYKLIQTYTEDLADITHESQFFAVAKNMASAVQGANGLRAVQHGLSNLYSGLIWDEFTDLMTSKTIKFAQDGSAEVTGASKNSWRNFSEAGLSSSDLKKMRELYAKNPKARFPDNLEVKFEVAAQRRTDRLLQQSRLGETSHFVALNPIGRLIVGYQAFAMTATSNVLAKAIANGDVKGMAMMFLYQAPLMLMATYAKAVLDGKGDEITGQELITNSIQNMGMLGIVANTMDIFTNRDPKSEIAMLASVNAFRKGLADIASGAVPDFSKMLPFAQTAVPIRAVINNIDSN